jgi:hypothetical protein
VPLTTVSEPLFLLLALASVVTLLTAAAFAVGGRFARARRILRRLGIAALIYFVIVIAVSLLGHRREYRIGDTQCFDDWCITVVGARRTATPPSSPYEVALRLSNRARRTPMGEKGTVVYLTDAQGRRFNPLPDAAAVPFDTKLAPGESVATTRRFDIPKDARDLGLVYTHEGGFPIGWLIIGEGGWFQKPPIVWLSE